MTPGACPDAVDASRVGEYPASAKAGGGYVWDEVLEYRVWCHPERGADDLEDGSDYYYAFATQAEAAAFAAATKGAEAPLALILQREYIDEPEPGRYVHVKAERVAEWPVEFLRRPRRTPTTIPDFLSPWAPPERLDILRGLAAPPGARLRVGEPRDAADLARFAEDTFRATFAEANTAADMDLHCRRSYGETIQALELADPDRLTVLAGEEGRLVGYAQLRWDAAPACVAAARPGEIQRLYVAADRHGRGLSQSLMSACFDALRERGSDVAWLGVWERNPRAIAFYRKLGFAAVGEHVFPLGEDPQRDIVMARPVAD